MYSFSYPHPSIYSIIYLLSTNPFIHPFIHHSCIHLIIHQSIHAFIHQSIHPCIHPFMCSSTHPSIRPSTIPLSAEVPFYLFTPHSMSERETASIEEIQFSAPNQITQQLQTHIPQLPTTKPGVHCLPFLTQPTSYDVVINFFLNIII